MAELRYIRKPKLVLGAHGNSDQIVITGIVMDGASEDTFDQSHLKNTGKKEY